MDKKIIEGLIMLVEKCRLDLDEAKARADEARVAAMRASSAVEVANLRLDPLMKALCLILEEKNE